MRALLVARANRAVSPYMFRDSGSKSQRALVALIHRLADRAARAAAPGIRSALAALRDGADHQAIAQAFSHHSAAGVSGAVSFGLLPAHLSTLFDAQRRVLLQAAEATASTTVAETGQDFAFDGAQPDVAAWLAAAEAHLPGQLADSSRAAIEETAQKLLDGTLASPSFDDSLALILATIGLNSLQAGTLRAYFADEVDAGLEGPALALKLGAAADKLLGYRAADVASHESYIAASHGRLLAWKQAQKQGALSGNALQRWLTSELENVCGICEPMDDQEVPIGQPFIGGDGAPYYAPGDPHVKCNCGVLLSAF